MGGQEGPIRTRPTSWTTTWAALPSGRSPSSHERGGTSGASLTRTGLTRGPWFGAPLIRPYFDRTNLKNRFVRSLPGRMTRTLAACFEGPGNLYLKELDLEPGPSQLLVETFQ